MEPPSDRSRAYEFVFRESARAVSEQAGVLESLRTRAGTLVAVSALVTGFIGEPAMSDGAIGVAGALALGALLVVVTLNLFILWPVRDWYSTFDTPKLLTDYVEADEPARMDEMHRDIALHIDNGRKKNSTKLRLRHRIYAVAVVVLGLELAAWTLEIAPQVTIQ